MEENSDICPDNSISENRTDTEIRTDDQIIPDDREKNFPNWKDVLLILLVFLVSQLLVSFVAMLIFGAQLSGFATFVSYITTFGITIAFALSYIKKRTGAARNPARISFRGFNPAMILWGLILMLAANVVIEPLITLFPSEWYDMVGDQLMNGGWAMFTAIVMAPVCEEILFRGIIQGSLVCKRGPWGGILIASAVFGLIHGIPQQVVAGFCLGIIMGFIYYRTGSLLSVMVLHAINNSLAVFTTLFETDGNLQEQSLREIIGSDPAYWAFYAVCAGLLLLSLLRVAYTIRRDEKSAPDGKNAISE